MAVFLIHDSAVALNEKMEGVPIPPATRDVRLSSHRVLTEFANLRESARRVCGRLTGRTHYARQKVIRLTAGFDPGSFVGSKVL